MSEKVNRRVTSPVHPLPPFSPIRVAGMRPQLGVLVEGRAAFDMCVYSVDRRAAEILLARVGVGLPPAI